MKKIILQRRPEKIAFRVSVCFTALLLGVVFLWGENLCRESLRPF